MNAATCTNHLCDKELNDDSSFWFNVLKTVHKIAIAHCKDDSIAGIFNESIVKANELKKENRIKCGWIKCTRWTTSDTFYRCKKCKVVIYCSKHCQKKDWKRGLHKLTCKLYRDAFKCLSRRNVR